MSGSTFAYFSPCPRGLEGALARELNALSAADVRTLPGGVSYRGDRACGYRVNLWSRIASRVLREAAASTYRGEEDIYKFARGLPWPQWFSVERRIRVDITANRSPLRSLDFAALRIKDAVCDQFREAVGARPSVDTRAPDVRIAAFLDERRITLYLDCSGEGLFKRGYRSPRQEAPLKENLAAGLIALSGWDPASEAFLDPMCGSGTLVVEAALIAACIAPGLRRAFAFQQLSDYDSAAWEGLLREARSAAHAPAAAAVRGSDINPSAVRQVNATLDGLGLAGPVSVEQRDVADASPHAPHGVWLTNPPYGVRVGEAAGLAALYPRIGTALKRRFAGWRCYVLSADKTVPRQLGLRESRRTPLFNGAIECRLFEFKMVSGSLRRERPGAAEG